MLEPETEAPSKMMSGTSPQSASTAGSEQSAGLSEREKSPLEEYLLSLHRLASALAESSIFAESGLGLAEWVILRELDSSPVPMATLIRRTRVSRQRVRVLLKELKTKGLIAIVQGSEGDRRERAVVASPAAVAALRTIAGRLDLMSVSGGARGVSRLTRLNLRLTRELRALRLPVADASPDIGEPAGDRQAVRLQGR